MGIGGRGGRDGEVFPVYALGKFGVPREFEVRGGLCDCLLLHIALDRSRNCIRSFLNELKRVHCRD